MSLHREGGECQDRAGRVHPGGPWDFKLEIAEPRFASCPPKSPLGRDSYLGPIEHGIPIPQTGMAKGFAPREVRERILAPATEGILALADRGLRACPPWSPWRPWRARILRAR